MAGKRVPLETAVVIFVGVFFSIPYHGNGQSAFCDVCYCFRRDDNTTRANCDPDKLDFTKPLNFPETPTNVTYLDISFGFTTADLVNNFFSSMPRLKELYFYLQDVDNMESMTFNGLPVLEILSLSYNSMFKFPATPLQQVAASLLELNVTHNAISSLPADSLRGYTKLRSLDLSRLSLRYLDRFAFRGLGVLRYLVLHGNYLTTLNAGIFDDLTSLEVLDLRTNYFVEVPAAVNRMHLLTTFRFSFNPTPFRFHDFEFIRRMPNIQTLDFVNCSIHTVSAAAIENLKSAPKLASVYLYKNPFLCTPELCQFVKYYTSYPGIDFRQTGSDPVPYECSLPVELRGYSLDEVESMICGYQSSSSTISTSTTSSNWTTSTVAGNTSLFTTSSSPNGLSTLMTRTIIITPILNLVFI